jgi:phage/plasmid-associated DNA primase
MMGGGLAAETANPLGDVFGSHGNLHIGKILVSIDEMNASDTNKVLDRLKNFITSDEVIYNEKGLKAFSITNSARVMFSTNNSIPISLEGHRDRRYVFIEADNKWCKDSGHWVPFYEEVIGDDGVLRGFYDLLMKRDLSARDWSAIPQTEIRQEMIEATVHPIVFWFDKFIHDHPIDRVWTPAKLYEHYKSYCGEHGYTCCSNVKAFGIVFKDQIPLSECGVEKKHTNKGMTYRFNRETAFEWMKNQGFSQYESLVLIEDEDDDP